MALTVQGRGLHAGAPATALTEHDPREPSITPCAPRSTVAVFGGSWACQHDSTHSAGEILTSTAWANRTPMRSHASALRILPSIRRSTSACVPPSASLEDNRAVRPCIGEMHTIRVQSSAHFLMKAKIQHRGTHVSGASAYCHSRRFTPVTAFAWPGNLSVAGPFSPAYKPGTATAAPQEAAASADPRSAQHPSDRQILADRITPSETTASSSRRSHQRAIAPKRVVTFASLWSADACRLQDFAVSRHLRLDRRSEIFGRAGRDLVTGLQEGLFALGRLQIARDIAVQA